MRLPSINRLAQTFAEAPQWFRSFAQQLNDFLKEVNSGFDGKITLSENIKCQEIINYTFQTALDYEMNDTFLPLVFEKKHNSRIVHATLTSIYETNAPGNIITTGPNINGGWVDDGDSFVVRYVSGLKDSTVYTVSFLIF